MQTITFFLKSFDNLIKNLFKKYPYDAKYKIGNLNEVNKVLRSI